jgi:hypothetical protein
VAIVAGSYSGTGSSGDGGPAVAARFNQIAAIALDSTGALYIGDAGASRIRKLVPATP